MTEKQIEQIENQISKGEQIDRIYRAFEGDIRVITKNNDEHETCYSVSFDADGNASIKRL